MRAAIGLLLLLLVAFIILFTFSATPLITFSSPITAIGQATPVRVDISDPHGVRRAAAYVEQNGQRYKLAEVSHRSRHFRWLRSAAGETLKFTAGAKSTPQLRDGNARLVVEATSNDFRGKTVEAERDVIVATQPVTVSADSDQHYLYVGMADLVTYNVSGSPIASGVRVGDETFRGWPMPGGKPGQFSIFAFAWNMPPNTA